MTDRASAEGLRGYPVVSEDKDGGSVGWVADPIGAYVRWDDLAALRASAEGLLTAEVLAEAWYDSRTRHTAHWSEVLPEVRDEYMFEARAVLRALPARYTAALRDTGSRPDSGIRPTPHDMKSGCQHTGLVLSVCDDCNYVLGFSTPRTETSE